MTMKLRRVRLESFRRFRSSLVIDALADGLNVFAAPNESGKSTVVEAIRAAFFERHRSSSVEHLRPWGDSAATPTVELDFEIDGKRCHLLKSFLGKKRCELSIDTLTLDGVAAEDHLAALLGFRFPGKGASSPEHMGIPGLLWIRQGTSHDLAEPVGFAADHLRQALGASMGDLAASGGDAVLRAVEDERNALLSPSGARPRGSYAEAIDRTAALEAEVASLQADVQTYRGAVDRLALLRAEHDRDEAERPWEAARQAERDARARLEAAAGLQARRDAEAQTLQQLAAQAAATRAQLEGLRREEEAASARRADVEAAAQALERARAEVAAHELRHRDAVLADETARGGLRKAREAENRQTLQRSVDELAGVVGRQDDTLGRARGEQSRLRALNAQIDALAVDAASVARLKACAERLRSLDVRLEARATGVEFELLPGRSLAFDGERVQGQARRTVVRKAELLIEGVGRIVVTPGGADLDALVSERNALADERAMLLERLGVASLGDLEAQLDRQARLKAEAQQAQAVLGVLAPQGVEALAAEFELSLSRLAQARAALELKAAAQDDQAETGEVPSLSAAEAAADAARLALQQAGERLMEARVALGAAESRHVAALQEHRRAESVLLEPARARRVEEATAALTDVLALEAAARRRLDDIGAQIATAGIAMLRQDVERFGASAQQMEQDHQRRATEIVRLEAELGARGASGLEEALADRLRDLAAFRRRLDELQRRADALDHLLERLRKGRFELARRMRAPLQKHLNHYLQILFPGASLEVGDDLAPGPLSRVSAGRDERGPFEQLSVGTREQMGVLARFAYADLLRDAGRPTLLILDDALVHTDDSRRAQMKRLIYDASTRHQVLVFTCHPAAWRDLGVATRPLGAGAAAPVPWEARRG